MVFLPALAWLATAYGWRYDGAVGCPCRVIVVFPIVAAIVRDRPQSIGLQPLRRHRAGTCAPSESKHPFRPAIKGPS